MNTRKIYACIDLKSFYASVECVQRQLDPFSTDLVVADASRGRGAITLAITPSLKTKGIKNRCRLFEIPANWEIIIAKPQMKLYMEYSARIYGIYLKFFAKEDIYVYSIDECFIYLTPYLNLYKLPPLELVKKVMEDVKQRTGICATGGIGGNLFLAKVALDITAKHSPTNIGIVDQNNFDQLIAAHRPITDIWGIGKGTAQKLARYGVYDLLTLRTMPVKLLKNLFGINYQIILDHAYGIEPTTIAEIKNYRPKETSLSHSQILMRDYNYQEAWQILGEMLEVLTLELISKNLSTNHLSLQIKYSKDTYPTKRVSKKLQEYTHSYKDLLTMYKNLYFNNVDKNYPIRQISLALGGLATRSVEAINLFADLEKNSKEDHMQEAMLNIKAKFGKNSIFRANNLLEHSTALERNKFIGGHHG